MHDDKPRHQDELAAETDLSIGRIISRMIDGESTDADVEVFERRAAAEPTLWRQYALEQRDMEMLTKGVRDATAAGAAVDLDHASSNGGPLRGFLPGNLTWTLTFSGWAAMIIVGLTWGITAFSLRPEAKPQVTPTMMPFVQQYTSEEHFQRYLDAPYVLGDMQPVVMEVKELSDGRVAVHFVRRSEEVLFLDVDAALPVDENGELLRDLSALRGR